VMADKSGSAQISISPVSVLENYDDSENIRCLKMGSDIENNKILNSHVTNMHDKEQLESPVGRLRSCIEHWQMAEPGEHILTVISEGYRLPFKNIPQSVELENNRSARENIHFVSSEIRTLLAKGCIMEVAETPYVVNPLTVAYNRHGKPRLVLDCRHINPDLFKFKFCYENHDIARHIFAKGDFLYSFDIKGAYHHVMIFPEHTTYLGFSWTESGKKRYFVFRVLPFGISTAGYIFTKILRVIIKKWRDLGMKIILFLDDGLGGANTLEISRKESNFVRQDLINFGFLLAEEKCQWEPTQQSIWVGYFWDTCEGLLKVTEERIARVESLLNFVINSICKGIVLFPVKKLACLTGQLISMMSVFGSVVRLRTRNLYDCVNSRASWDAPVKISSGAFDELIYWKENLRNLNQCMLHSAHCDVAYVFDDASGSGNCNYANVFVDASNIGFGGYIQGVAESDIVGSWLESESNLSSTWRELESVYRIVNSFVPKLQGKKVLLNTDNKNVCSVLKNGSKKPHLHDIALKVDKLCTDKQISLQARWLPRKHNADADFLSRCMDSDDWSVVDWVFKLLDEKWGKHTFDRFACHYNTKCKDFNSRYWCPGTAGIDAFEQIWAGENNWLVPPPRLILRCINKIKSDKCGGTLVVPAWHSAPFWPFLFPAGKRASFIKDFLQFQPGVLTKRGLGRNGVFDGRPLSFSLIALRFQI
jgi:hypothetical protein